MTVSAARDAASDAQGSCAVGIDVVAVDRFAASLRRTPALAGRLFTAGEQRHRLRASRAGRRRWPPGSPSRRPRPRRSACPPGWTGTTARWCPRIPGDRVLEVSDTVAAAAAALGVTDWRISISHDAGIAAAVVIALG